MSKMVVCPYGREARILPMQNITKQEVYDECYKMQKKLKALEIITKYCDICIQEYPEHNFYRVIIMRKQTNAPIMSCSFETTKEEYDLLKEVLLND